MSSPSIVPELEVIEDRAVDPAAGATATAFDPVQGVLAVGHSTGSISLFAAKYTTNSQLQSGSGSPITHIQFIPGQPALVSIDEQGMLRVFDLDTLEFCFAYQVPLAPTCLGVFAGTTWVLVGTDGGRVYFVDAINGRKSDFSIGCLVKPTSPVAAVESHPVEAEKILIAYSEGTCVICDLGKASVSEKAMVLSKHRFEHPEPLNQTAQSDPWLLCAGWSPTGDRLAASYSNGVLAIFGPGSGSAPLVARTIQCPDILPKEAAMTAAARMDRKLLSISNVRWCTHPQLDRSFLAVTSGSTVKLQNYIHILGTGGRDANVKSSRDILVNDSYDIGLPLVALGTVPGESPWRNGNDGVRGLAVLVGRNPHIQVLALQPDLRLKASKALPGELKWCAAPATQQFYSEGELSTALGRALAQLLVDSTLITSNSARVDADTAEPRVKDISGLCCCVESSGGLSLWCISSRRLHRCDGVDLDLRYLARLVGAEGQVSSVSMSALSGLLAIGTDTGETFISVLTSDPWASIAQNYTPFAELCRLALPYYSERPQEPQPSDSPRNTRPYSTQADMLQSKHSSVVHRSRSTSLHEGNFIRRNSKRLSSSFGTLFRRGSSASGHLKSASKQSVDANDVLNAGVLNIKAAVAGVDISPGLARPAELVASAWAEQLSRLNAEMSTMVYGLRFNAAEQQRLAGASQPNQNAQAPAADGRSSSQTHADPSQASDRQPCLHVLPFMLARFAYSSVVSVVAGHSGMVAISYTGGAIVVVDIAGQSVVLVDNINLAPNPDASVNKIFGNGIVEPATISTMAFAVDSNSSKQILLAGTSRGHIYKYSLGDPSTPPKVVARAPTGLVEYLALEDGQTLVVGTPLSISVHPQLSAKPAAIYNLPGSNAQLVRMRIVRLSSGWRGIAAVDSQAKVILLSLPDLSEVARLTLPGDAQKLVHSAEICIDDNGRIQMLGSNGRLLQTHIAARGRESEANRNARRSYFNMQLPLPPQPTRKGITSWLLGKATDPSADIDAFLGSHRRDLLSSGGRKPGAQLRAELAPLDPEHPTLALNKRSRQDSKVGEIDRSLNADEFSETKDMLEKRGQQLDDVSEAVQHLSMQSEGFLKKVRAYNAEQEKKSKRFGLF
ncbi:Lethal(2) giant larvae sro7 [Coemansia sp. RSA 2611]|nr:Lethal(2) giant larvae sro7 [Coemansia sp. RSA 2611]